MGNWSAYCICGPERVLCVVFPSPWQESPLERQHGRLDTHAHRASMHINTCYRINDGHDGKDVTREELRSGRRTNFRKRGCCEKGINNKNNTVCTGYILHAIFSKEHKDCYNHMVTKYRNIVTKTLLQLQNIITVTKHYYSYKTLLQSQNIDKTPTHPTTQLIKD